MKPANSVASHGTQPNILVERRDGVAIVTLNRPNERNPLGLDLADHMLDILEDLERDGNLHAVILTGAGSVFCAGAELGKVLHPDGIDSEQQYLHLRGFSRVVQRVRDLDLPVIAAVNGAAVGGGAALALACDIAIAAEGASYYFAFGRVGAAGCDMGCSYFLPKLVGTIRAKHWLLTGATIGAEQGRIEGLFVDICPRDQLLGRALDIAAQIKIATPRRAAAITKLAVARSEDADFQTCIAYETHLQNYLFTGDEHKIRLQSLLHRKIGARPADSH